MPELIDGWRTEISRLWSIRVVLFWTIFWSGLGGLCLVWPAFMGLIPVGWFVGIGILTPVTLAVARILKQPGT